MKLSLPTLAGWSGQNALNLLSWCLFEASARFSKAAYSCMLFRQREGELKIQRGERITACTHAKGTNIELSCFCKLVMTF